MNYWGKIAFAVRVGMRPDPVFFQDWTRLCLKGLRDGDRVLSPVIEMPQHYAAEFAAKTFLSGPADTILFIDDDMSFKIADIEALRDDPESEHYDAVQALCLSRNPPHRPIILERGAKPGTFLVRSIPPKSGIVDVGAMGLGFTLVRRRVFERVAESVGDSEMMFQWSARGDSEDCFFFQKAVEAGCRIGVNAKVCVGHRVTATVLWNHEQENVQWEERDRGVGRTLPPKWYEQQAELERSLKATAD